MKFILSHVLVFFFLNLFGQNFYPKFAATTGLSARDMEIDATGNLYVVGHGSVASGCLPVTPISNSGGAFLAKFDPLGNLIWSLGFGGNSAVANGLAIDPDGEILVTGSFEGTANFFTDSGNSQTLTSLGEEDIFVLKIDKDGELKWAVSVGETSDDLGYDVAVDSEGNIFVTGTFQWEVDFNGPKINSTNFKNDAFIWAITPDGATMWVDNYPSFFDSEGTRITVDLNDNVICTGSYFDQQIEATSFFVWKKNPNGDEHFKKLFSGTDRALGFGITSDSKNNIIIAGQFGGTLDFDPGSDTLTLTAPAWWLGDAFVLKLDESGDFIWVKQTGKGVGFDSANAVASDENDNIFICGYFTGAQVDFDPGPGVFHLETHVEGADIYTQLLDENGDFIWAGDFEYEGFGQYDGLAIAVSHDGHQFYAGGMVRQGNFEGVIRGFSDCPIEVVQQNLEVCKSYNLNGTEISEFCNYRTSIPSSTAGCDTIFNINIVPLGNSPINLDTIDGEYVLFDIFEGIQWLNCDGFVPVVGETGDIFIPNETGNYAAEVSYFETCRDTSHCIFIDLGTSATSSMSDFTSEVKVYPNPSMDGVINLDYSGLSNSIMEFYIYDLSGNNVWNHSVPVLKGENKLNLNLAHLTKAMYLIEARNESVSFWKKLLIN